MTKDEVDKACERFLESQMIPEDFFNQLVEERDEMFSFEDSKALLNLFYDLQNIDQRILICAKNMEESL